ncbi:Carrier protein, mitochondrial [Actinomortierella ambigua]|nr:Carrier protein, mitochondrial [Actinomortierella ambigua]
MIPSLSHPRPRPSHSSSNTSASSASYLHQPSARSPLSNESTPFGLFRHKNLSTSALPNSPTSSPRTPAAPGPHPFSQHQPNSPSGPVPASSFAHGPRGPAGLNDTSGNGNGGGTGAGVGGGGSFTSVPRLMSMGDSTGDSTTQPPQTPAPLRPIDYKPSTVYTPASVSSSLPSTTAALSPLTAIATTGASEKQPPLVLPPLPALTKVSPNKSSSNNLAINTSNNQGSHTTTTNNSNTTGDSLSSPLRTSSHQYPIQFYAWWDYIAQEQDEVSFKKGDLLQAHREFDDLWCLGTVMKPDRRSSARNGFFPLQYCSCDPQCYVPPTKIAHQLLSGPSTSGPKSPAVPYLVEPGMRLCIVIPFNGTSHDELVLRQGNQVRVIHLFDDGWVVGEQIDHAGVTLATGAFPLAVAKLVTAEMLQEQGLLKQKTAPGPLSATQDSSLVKAGRQREDGINHSSNSGSSNTALYHNTYTSQKLAKQSSPSSPPFQPATSGAGAHRPSPSAVQSRSPLSGLAPHRGAGSSPNRGSVQSVMSTTSNSSSIHSYPAVSEEQVIRALQERPVQDTVVQVYLAQGGDPNIQDANGNSLLHLAVKAQSQEALVFLMHAPGIRLEEGAPVSPLYTAVRFRAWKIAKQLLIVGADPNVADERGLTVLHVVLSLMTKGDPNAESVVQLLCEKADVNATAHDKKTIPIRIAVAQELWAETDILLAHGANPFAIFPRDRRASSLPVLNSSQNEIGTSATTTPGFVNSPMPIDYMDPLREAVRMDCVPLVRQLLKYFYSPTSFPSGGGASSSSPTPSPSSTQSAQSFFGSHYPHIQPSVASSYTTNNSSTTNIAEGHGPVPTPISGIGVHGHGTPTSIPSPCSAQSSPTSGVLHGYMNRANSLPEVHAQPPSTSAATSQPLGQHQHQPSLSTTSTVVSNGSTVVNPILTATTTGPTITAIPAGGPASSAPSTLSMSSMAATMIPYHLPQPYPYLITPKILMYALDAAKELGRTECLYALSRPELALKEGSPYYGGAASGWSYGGTGGYGMGSAAALANANANAGSGTGGYRNGHYPHHHSPYHPHYHHLGGHHGHHHVSGKEHRTFIQKLTGIFKA